MMCAMVETLTHKILVSVMRDPLICEDPVEEEKAVSSSFWSYTYQD